MSEGNQVIKSYTYVRNGKEVTHTRKYTVSGEMRGPKRKVSEEQYNSINLIYMTDRSRKLKDLLDEFMIPMSTWYSARRKYKN